MPHGIFPARNRHFQTIFYSSASAYASTALHDHECETRRLHSRPMLMHIAHNGQPHTQLHRYLARRRADKPTTKRSNSLRLWFRERIPWIWSDGSQQQQRQPLSVTRISRGDTHALARPNGTRSVVVSVMMSLIGSLSLSHLYAIMIRN